MRPRANLYYGRQPSCRCRQLAALCRRPTRPRLGGWPPRILGPSFPSPSKEQGGRGCARSDHQLGQQCCPMRKMADSEHQYKAGHVRRVVRHGLSRPYARKFADVLRAKWITAAASAQGAERLKPHTGPAITASRLILWFR